MFKITTTDIRESKVKFLFPIHSSFAFVSTVLPAHSPVYFHTLLNQYHFPQWECDYLNGS